MYTTTKAKKFGVRQQRPTVYLMFVVAARFRFFLVEVVFGLVTINIRKAE